MLFVNPILQSAGSNKSKQIDEIEMSDIDKKEVSSDNYVNVGNDEFKELAGDIL
jgi:hypothetical protein